MPVQLTTEIIAKLRRAGVSTLHQPGAVLPDDVTFEPPCSLKWMSVQQSLYLGAFSYAVSGFYFACRIGRYCSFGEQVQIGRHSHSMHWASTSPFFYMPFANVLDQDLPDSADLIPNRDFQRTTAPVVLKVTTIGNDVWIGHGAFVLPGVRIGDGAVVAAMSVVTKDVPPYAMVAGSPAKVVRYRFADEQVAALLSSKWWQFAPWQLKGAPVDDIPKFVDFIAALKSSGAKPYAPRAMTIADVLNAVAPSLPGIVAQSALASSSGGAAIDIGHDDAALSSTRAREGQDGGLTQAVAEYSEAAEFPQGPRIPFIQFGRFLALADGVSLSLRGKRCVDFGCGAARPFSIASLMYLLGAESAIAIDVTPCADTAAIAKGLWFMLDALSAGNSGLEQYATYDLELVKARLIDFDADALRQGRLMEGLPKAIRHCVGDYLAIESELGVFDVMISNSVFEHIPDLDRTMRAFRKNLRQGGVIYADIDYRDHRFYVSGASPWQYLMDDDDVSPGYINKVRHAAMKQLVGNAGLRIVASAQVVTPAPPEVLQNMHARYRGASVDDLAVVQDSVLLQL